MGIYRRPDSPTWWMSLQLNGQRVRLNTLVEDRQLAEEFFCAWKTEIARARWLGAPTPDGNHTVAELIAQYLRMVSPRKSSGSQERDRISLARFATRWGKLLLRDLTTLMIEEYLAERIAQVSFASVSKELGILKAAFRCAIRWGWASHSPFLGIVLNQEGTARTRWLSEDEEARLLVHCAAWLSDIIVVGLDTGLRPGNLVRFQRAWVQRAETSLIIPREQTKTKKLPLTIPLTKRAADIILRYFENTRSEYLFVSTAGHPYTCTEVNRALQRAAVKAGVCDICLYTLRHSFISRLVQAGVSLPEVAALAGHRDIRMSMRYAHLAPEHLRNSIATLEAEGPNGPRTISRPTCERRGRPMHTCRFCRRDDFPSRQSFNAHCRWCDAYKQHKQNLNSASGTSVRQAVPKAQPDQVTSPPIASALLPHTNDPFAPFRDFLQGLGVQPPNAGETQETPQQKRRRLLQAAKSQAIDHYWSLTRTLTPEMRAEARLAIDRELRDEPLDEFTPQEVRELAECVRERVYLSIQRRQENEARRGQDAEDRKRARQLQNNRKQQERIKKKDLFLTEARRRAIVLFQTRSLSLLQRIHAMDEILSLIDVALTGDESLSEACASIQVVLGARVADWEAEDAAKAAKQQEEWIEFAVGLLVILAGGYTFANAPGILLWLLNMFSPKPADSPEAPKKPSEEAPVPRQTHRHQSVASKRSVEDHNRHRNVLSAQITHPLLFIEIAYKCHSIMRHSYGPQLGSRLWEAHTRKRGANAFSFAYLFQKPSPNPRKAPGAPAVARRRGNQSAGEMTRCLTGLQ